MPVRLLPDRWFTRSPMLIAGAAVGALYAWPAHGPVQSAAGDDAEVVEDWCAPGLELIDGGGCFAEPRVTGAKTPLLIYLHGRYSAETLDEEMDRQARVARSAAERGFAVLALRGSRGQCTQPEYAAWWCWPSNERNAGDGPSFVERWAPALEAARQRTGLGPTVLLGFSNGGYFAALIATRALFDLDAVAIAHGGPVQPTRAVGRVVPILLITASEDASDPEMRRLDSELTREGWPHTLVGRAGGHALPDWDIDAALDFFGRVVADQGLPPRLDASTASASSRESTPSRF